MKVKNIVLVVAAIAALLILSAGTVVTYGILFPPVWSHPLDYLNSTGQHQMVTEYRNATDVTYENLTRFISANDIEPLVYADTTYRPVEYAAILHDKAEAGGINCTVIGSGISSELPANAIDAFYTTDRGMVYVDPTAMNVSQEDYTVPFDRIRLLRDWWTTPMPWKDYNDQFLTITTHRNASPVTYDRLIDFLGEDNTEDQLYVLPNYSCVDFSAELYNNAAAEGIKCGFVSVQFRENIPGHAFNVFETTDKGLVFIDCTGINASCIQEGYTATDNNVYLQVGDELGELPYNQTNGNLDYAFYADRMQRIEAFKAKVDKYLDDVDAFEARSQELQNEIDGYNAQMNKHNSAVASFNAENSKQYQSYLDGAISYEAYKSWYDANTAKIPAGPGGGGSLNARKATLDQQLRDLDARRRELVNSEESKWITFNPEGTVASITTYWP